MAATFARSSTHGAVRRKSTTTSKRALDAIIVGGGHNGLVAVCNSVEGLNHGIYKSMVLMMIRS